MIKSLIARISAVIASVTIFGSAIVIYLNCKWMEFTGFYLWFSIISATLMIVAAGWCFFQNMEED